MRYIKPPDFPDVKAFQEKYRKAIDNITSVLTADASGKSVNELNKSINDALNAAMEYLTKVNRDYVKKQLPNAFDDYREELTKSPEMTKAEVNEELKKQGFKYSPKALARDSYIELQESVQAATNGTRNRVNSIIEQLRKTDEDTVYNVQQAIIQDLQTNGVTVEYANGAKQPLDAYASMAARSARIETANLGAIGRAMENGTDLVIMTTMPMCCKYCGAYQDKVYSISGKDKRFPALFKTVLKNGYALPHPNCRHEFIPYYEDMEDPDDVKKMIGKSKIKYDRKGQLTDVRSAKDIEQYKQWQAGNRQRNAESKAYEKYLAYCEANGIEPHYTTLAGFRRARRADRGSTAWNNSHLYENSNILKDPNKPSFEQYSSFVDSEKYETNIKSLNLPDDAKQKVVNECRRCIRKNNKTPNERSVLITPKGKIVYEYLTKNGQGRVVPPNGSKDLILVHNHPFNGSFSFEDLKTFNDNEEIKYIIAACHNGKLYYLAKNSNKHIDTGFIDVYNDIRFKYGNNAIERFAEIMGWRYKEI